MLNFIVRRKILVSLVTVLVLILGSYALTKLDEELLPEVDFDGAYVTVSAGDMAAIEVERSITTPLEQQIFGIDGVEDIYSTTTIGQSSLQIMIEKGRGEEVSKEVESVANSITSTVSGITEVLADQMSVSASYEFFMDVSNGDMDEMTAFAEDILEPRLEELPEVRDVSLMGIQKYEVTIEFDRDAMSENALDISQVRGIIQQANMEATLGELKAEEEQPSLRWESRLESVEDVEIIQIPTQSGFIDLDEVADISLQPLESSSYVWKNGTKDFIFVQIGSASDVTQIDMAEAVREEIENIRDEGLVGDFELNELVAQADYVKESIDGVTSNILIGGILAIVVLLVFLRNVRATIIIGISIPTSILLTILSMWILDYSLNMLTLIALGLGIGMMVDASIVILESIYKKKEQGIKPLVAVIDGTKEVASAVIASILTTIVVFVPIGLMGGDVGQFMVLLSVVVAITLVSSVIVSFTLIPTLSERFLTLRRKKTGKEGRFIQGYGRFISWVIKKKRNSLAMIVLFFFMFVGSLFLVFKIPMTIMPDILNRYAELIIDLETGVSIEDKEDIALKISDTLSEIEDVKSSYIIDDGSMFFMLINMTKGEEITTEQKEVNEEILSSLRELDEDYPINSVQSAMSVSVGSPIQIQIQGENYEELQTIVHEFTKELDEIEGIVGINNSIERTSIEKVVELQEEAIKDAGLSEMQVREGIGEAFINMPIDELDIEEESVPIVMKWDEKVEDESALLEWKLPTIDGDKALSTFIKLKSVDTPNEISHSNGERFITVSADIENTDLGTVNREVQGLISNFETPKGYTISAGGDLESQQELIFDMILIFVISMFLVYLVMAVQFNHLAHPFIVMSVIPMTIVGVILGLFLTQRELSVMSGMGIIMLIGIVLNNAILLIDRTNQLRKAGYTANEALLQAGKDRIRPIFMTTLTTIGGMLPLALAAGTTGNYQAPMATAIISGLSFATIITLVLVPSVYRIFNAIGNGFGRIFRKKKKEDNEPAESVS
ncbi:efflux RND transporter permease subunit [Oceanobacillus bengalensis]|uniref:Efflux RND transporter permease subunit n=1 Tax=Oceanobacillus bengalensis TaxID=1435466 RepID=A0A494YZ99_9BACI|nr:efflux RND transporter permease subunit [Oceanobacillus bengalensis]RKQ15565.1 efflux RND transporter permease subunit [Oceanobacillus bengalensis]